MKTLLLLLLASTAQAGTALLGQPVLPNPVYTTYTPKVTVSGTVNVSDTASVLALQSIQGALTQTAGLTVSWTGNGAVNLMTLNNQGINTNASNTTSVGRFPATLFDGASGRALSGGILNGNLALTSNGLVVAAATVASNGTSLTVVRSTFGSDSNPALDVYVKGNSATNTAVNIINGTAATSYFDKLTSTVGAFSKDQVDAFGRLRVTNYVSIFDFKRTYGSVGLFFQNITFGAGAATTLDTNFSSMTITSGSTATGYAIQQTRPYFVYEPGAGIKLMLTVNVMGAVTGTVKRFGLYDASDGVFFEVSQTAANLAVVQRSSTSGSAVDTKVIQGNWNIDKLDGTGVSGKTLDITKLNLFFIEQAWLGAGSVWYGVVIDGKSYYCHVSNNENRTIGPYTHTATLPCRIEVQNIGTGPAALAYASSVGWSLQGEGDYHSGGRSFAQSNQAASGAINNGTTRVLMSLRLRSAWKRGNLKPTYGWHTQSTANSNGKLEVWLLQGGAGMGTAQNSLTWTSASFGRSAVEFTENTYTLSTATAGVVCLSGDGSSGVNRGSSFIIDSKQIAAGADYDGNQDVVALVYTAQDGNAVCPGFGLSWTELF